MPDWRDLSRAHELRDQLDESRAELERMSSHLTDVQARVDRLRSEQTDPPPPEPGPVRRFTRRERFRKVRAAVLRPRD